MRKLKLKQFNESVGDIAKDFFRTHLSKRKDKIMIHAVHNTHDFDNFIDMVNNDINNTISRVVVLYESILMTDIDQQNTSPNIEKLKSIKDKLEYVVVCGNQHSLEYLWGSDSFTKMFTLSDE